MKSVLLNKLGVVDGIGKAGVAVVLETNIDEQLRLLYLG
jgi:hypothetical protein